MLKKAILALGTGLSLFLLWFALYSYRQSLPIAEENLRGLALSLTAAIENLAVQDPSLAELAKFKTADLAYFALIDSQGIYRCHSNPDLIGTSASDGTSLPLSKGSPAETRVTLGTGERAFQYTTPVHLPGQTFTLRLTLHTYRADSVIRRAKVNTTILLGLVVAGGGLIATLIRYARREELHQIELSRRQNLAKMGEMGAMLAHEIRNPLSGIKGFAQVIAKSPTHLRNGAFAERIVTEAVRLETLVTGLLAYASSDTSPHAAFDLSVLIDHTVSLLVSEAHELDVKIVDSCQEGLQIIGNKDRLQQALLNLGRNALQAMPGGGELEIVAAAVREDVVITFTDNGAGICEQDLQQVFVPFFTTKARGTGLGLALCKKVVEEHGGTIELASEIDKGTTATLTLPLLQRNPFAGVDNAGNHSGR